MKPKNTNVEIISSGGAELKVSFIHKEVNPNYLDINVFIGWKKSDSDEHYLKLADAKVKVYMPSSTIYEDIAYNPKSTWESHLINMIYDLDEQVILPKFKHLEDLEFNPVPFFMLHSISFVPARMDEILHVFFQAFFRQYPFGVLFLKDMYDDSMSKKDKEDLKNTLSNYFEIIKTIVFPVATKLDYINICNTSHPLNLALNKRCNQKKNKYFKWTIKFKHQ